MIYRKYEMKTDNKWRETFRTEDEAQVYKDFSAELVRSKMWKSRYYTKVTNYSNYDGTYTWVFYTNYGTYQGRSTYVVAL